MLVPVPILNMPSFWASWGSESAIIRVRARSACDAPCTELASCSPEGLRIKVGRVHTIRGGVDPRELSLVEVDEGGSFLLHDLVGFGLTQWRHLPAAICCKTQNKNTFTSGILGGSFSSLTTNIRAATFRIRYSVKQTNWLMCGYVRFDYFPAKTFQA